MLNAMGIDVWFQRPTSAELATRRAETTTVLRGATPAERSRREPPRRGAPDDEAKPVSDVQPTSVIQTEVGASPQTLALSSSDPQAAPFALLCFRNSAAMLFCPAPMVRTRQRLARDILDSVALLQGAAAGSVQMTEFVYPPQQQPREGQGVAVAPPDRVLRAFLGRQLAGIAEPHLLICADALTRFTGWFEQPHRVIPALDDLYGDAGRKRTLWQELLNG